MFSKKIKLILFILFTVFFLEAEDIAEIFSIEGETYFTNEIVENLEGFRKSPLNINKASREDLEKLPWLNEDDINNIIKLRKTKKISDWNDLNKIGINEITISELKEYIIFKISGKKYKFNQVSRIEFQEKKKHFPSALKYFQKTIFKYNKFEFGFISQKDEGESNPLDFYSYFVQYKSDNILKGVVLGKYGLAFGQGILFASKLGTSKSAEATSTPLKKFNPIKPYKSSFEMWELEGSAINLEIGKINFIPFYSSTNLSANLDSTKITSFNESGIHLDESKKDNVNEKIYGAALHYSFKNNSAGINYYQIEFDHKFAKPDYHNKYNAFSTCFTLFRGFQPTSIEVAYADNKFAGIFVTRWGDNEFRQLLLFRYYEKNFPSWHGNPFSSQSNFDNETGFYYGITLKPFKNIKINFYFDLWDFPKTRYYEKMPTVGSEQFLQIEFSGNNNRLRLCFRHKNKEKYIKLQYAEIRDFERTLVRLDWFQYLNSLTLKTRCEIVMEYLKNEKLYDKGILVYEQLKYQIDRLKIIAQLTVYHSDILLYMYESNINGIMQNSVFSGDGIYSYFVVKYDLTKNFELQFKVSDKWNTSNNKRFYFQVLTNF